MPKTPALVPTVAARRGLRWYELDLNSFGITTLQSFDAMGPPRKIFLAPRSMPGCDSGKGSAQVR
jgi:hypothetical protein